MSGLAGQSIGLDEQSPTPIGGPAALDAESKGSMENFIGFGLDTTSYDPAPVDFDAADDTVTSAADGVTRYAPEYTDGQLVWGSGSPGVVEPPDQSIITVNVEQWFLTDPADKPLTADGIAIPNPWTPTQIDFNVAVSAGGPPNTIVVAEVNKFPPITSWPPSYMTSTPNQPDPFGGTGAVKFTMNTSSGALAKRSIDRAGSPAMVAPNGGFEVWVKTDPSIPILLVYPLDDSAYHSGYVNPVTEETYGNFSRIRVVEKREDGWARIWFGMTQNATCQNVYLYFCKDFQSNEAIWAGGETITLYFPRSADGDLPFRQDQLARFYRVDTVDHVDNWLLKAPFLDSEADNNLPRHVKVLLPDSYTSSKKYPVVYVADVSPTAEIYGQPIDIINSLGLQNQYDVIFCWSDFKSMPWYGTKDDGTVMCDVYFSQALVGLMDQQYSTLPDPENRLVLGFSKSGWGGLSMLMLRPETFGYAAGWDVPWDVQFGDYETTEAFGTEEQFQKYNPVDILPTHSSVISDKTRFVLAGYATFGPQTEAFKVVLEGYSVPFIYHYNEIPGGGTAHNWSSGWLSGVVSDLMSLIGR